MQQYQALQNIFHQSLTVQCISKKLTWADSEDHAKSLALENDWDFIPYPKIGPEHRIFDKSTSTSRPLYHDDVISESTPLVAVFEKIIEKKVLFVKSKYEMNHLVTLSDLNDIPVRIWLYGLISLLELQAKKMIDKHLPTDSWITLLQDAQQEKVNSLYANKMKTNEQISKIECLQFEDIGRILSKYELFRTSFGKNQSNRDFNNEFRQIKKLRDNLAHSNTQFDLSWDEIKKQVMSVTEHINQAASLT